MRLQMAAEKLEEGIVFGDVWHAGETAAGSHAGSLHGADVHHGMSLLFHEFGEIGQLRGSRGGKSQQYRQYEFSYHALPLIKD
jgi:hypothetical protein